MTRSLLVLLALLAVGCSSPDKPFLELVPNEAAERPPEPHSEQLLITWRPEDGEGPLEVTLPLPVDGPELTVRSLAVEVDAGKFEVTGDATRVLRLEAEDGDPAIRTRILLERRQPLTTPPLPEALQALPRSLPAEDWVARAAEAAPNVSARVVYGLVFDGSQVSVHAWPEVAQQRKWWAVELEPALPPERLRLGPGEPRALRDGAPTPLSVEVERQ